MPSNGVRPKGWSDLDLNRVQFPIWRVEPGEVPITYVT